MQRPSCRRAGAQAAPLEPHREAAALQCWCWIYKCSDAASSPAPIIYTLPGLVSLPLCLSASASASVSASLCLCLCLCSRSSHPLQSTSTSTSTSTNTSKGSNTTPTPPPHANAFSTLPRLPRLDCHTCRRCAHSTTSPPRSHDCARHDTACTLCLSLCGAAVPLHRPSPPLSPSPSLVLLSSAPALR
jgi:hypothetical protein